tara:strand:+ start:1213 stop:2796 length:1584 start_codon:yes stop_codon:yes gene_type:complete
MQTKQVQFAKRSVCKVMGVHRSFNFKEPYLEMEESQFGGTAFFVNPNTFGTSFPKGENDCRYALTNFHVVDELEDRHCLLKYPTKGNSCITASVVFVVPSLDVAILKIDPHGEHPMWFDSGDIRDFIEEIPNLKLDKRTIKGNSQNVVAIGFPNLSSDYQLAEGCISGRGLGMIQCTISLNGGNSGGPLMCKNKVIGICTASISESESLGLAVPIYQIMRFFQHWAKYDDIILTTPSWGVVTKPLTPDYMEYHSLDSAIQGCKVKRMIKNIGALYKSSIRENDILMGISSGNKRYNIDNYGLVTVEWTDKCVPIDNQEFIISLDPDDIRFDIFKWQTKRMKRNITIAPETIDFKVRHIYPSWEDVEYAILGGCVFMNLCMNHLDIDEEDEEAYCPQNQVIPISSFIEKSMNMETAVVVTHIPAQSHVQAQKLLKPFDRIIKCNKKRVKNVYHFRQLIQDAVTSYNSNSQEVKNNFIVIETSTDKIILNMHALMIREAHDCMRTQFPKDKCMLVNMNVQTRKRKRSLH